MSKLPVEEIEHKEEHPICENCGAEMKEIGKEKAYDELVFTPAKYHIRRHIVYTYKCTECGVNPEYDNDCADEIERERKTRSENDKRQEMCCHTR